jgi:hypothetical protein
LVALEHATSVSTPGRFGPAMTNWAPFHRSSTVLEGGKTSPVFPTAKQIFVPARDFSQLADAAGHVALGTIACCRSTARRVAELPTAVDADANGSSPSSRPHRSPTVPPGPEGVRLRRSSTATGTDVDGIGAVRELPVPLAFHRPR